MGIQIGAKPDAGFENPIGMLKDCHRRIEHFLQILHAVIHRAAGREMTEEERAAVQAALSYFRTGGQRHNADEEESLFPRMRAAGIDPAELEKVAALEHDHRDAEQIHSDVDRLYTLWLDSGRLSAEDEAALRSLTQQLLALYAQHIEIEEKIVFPCAAAHLPKDDIASMGAEFRARRSA